MPEQPKDLMMELLRRIRASQERTEADIAELKARAPAIEQHQGQLLVSLGSLNQRMDRFDERLARIERRLDLVEV